MQKRLCAKAEGGTREGRGAGLAGGGRAGARHLRKMIPLCAPGGPSQRRRRSDIFLVRFALLCFALLWPGLIRFGWNRFGSKKRDKREKEKEGDEYIQEGGRGRRRRGKSRLALGQCPPRCPLDQRQTHTYRTFRFNSRVPPPLQLQLSTIYENEQATNQPTNHCASRRPRRARSKLWREIESSIETKEMRW